MEQEQVENKKNEQNNLSIPVAIILAGVLIAGAVLLSGGDVSDKNTDKQAKKEVNELLEIQKDDHVLGNPDAKITILEFSDMECPFCKRYHETMHQIMDEYGEQVRWVYRHFPIDSIHPKARKEAEATECATELGGNDGFWNYIDKIFEITPSGNGLDLAILPDIAEEIGLDKSEFEECLSSGKYSQKVEDQLQNGVSLGVRGTPHSLVLFNDEVIPIEGAQPYGVVKSVIERALDSI